MIAFRTPEQRATARRRRLRSWVAFLLSDKSSYITACAAERNRKAA
jgi:hypothetical protein